MSKNEEKAREIVSLIMQKGGSNNSLDIATKAALKAFEQCNAELKASGVDKDLDAIEKSIETLNAQLKAKDEEVIKLQRLAVCASAAANDLESQLTEAKKEIEECEGDIKFHMRAKEKYRLLFHKSADENKALKEQVEFMWSFIVDSGTNPDWLRSELDSLTKERDKS